ncbi:MAG TPA: efflux RND transporter periplasmic adaptor subunit [Hydrogenophaga sp.]
MRTKNLVLLIVASLGLMACSRPEAPAEPVRAVKLTVVSRSAVTSQQELVGEVRARHEARLGFRVGGKLVERPVEMGQRVKVGQLLARLDGNDLTLASNAAHAQVSAAQTQRDLAAADLQRYVDLKAKGFVSAAEIERRQASLDAAEAALRQARAQSAVQGNQAGYARLVSDAGGVVVSVDADVGQVVSAGTPVVRIARDGPRDVVFSVPETQVQLLKEGQAAKVRLWSADDAATQGMMTGAVREVAASADPITRTYEVKVALPEGAPVALGATAYVRFVQDSGESQGAIKLPTSALMQARSGEKGQSAVWVFDDASGTVQSRAVEVAGVDGYDVVIASGLKEGEEVVAAGVHVLSQGQKVIRFAAQVQ